MRALNFIFSMTVLLGAVACTEKGQPYQKHEVARPTASEQPTSDVAQIRPDNQAYAFKENYAKSTNPVTEVMLPLARNVLSQAKIGDLYLLNSRSNQDELIVLNELILHATDTQKSQSDYAQVLSLYQIALNTDCGAIADSCKGMRYLKRAGNSFLVVKLLAKRDLTNRFRLLLFAIKMKNAYWDAEIITMLQTAPHAAVSQSESDAATAARHLLLTSLLQMQDKTIDPVEARRFLDAIGAWDMIEYRPEAGALNLNQATADSLFSTFARAGYLYAIGGELHPGLKALIQKRELEPNGYMGQQRILQTQNVFHPDAIGARFVEHLDELTYIIDSVFIGRISAQAGAQLFASSKRSVTELQQSVENYFRLQFALALYRSSNDVKAIFNADVQAQNLLNHVIKESASVARVWSSFKAKMVPLKSFAELAAATRPGSEATRLQITSLFDSTDKSILMTATYPQMLVLFHKLSQQRFTLRLPGSGRTADSGDLMSLLFNKLVGPLLPYSEEEISLNTFQMLYAFDMAVRTNLFEIAGIDTDFFISDTLRRLTGRTVDEINTELSTVSAVFKQDADISRLRNACAEFTTGQLLPRTMYVAEVKTSPYYGKLFTRTGTQVHSGTEGKTNGSTRPGDIRTKNDGIMYLDGEFGEMVEKAHLNLGTQLRIGDAMIFSYRNYLRRTGASAATIATKTTLSTKALDQIREKRQQVLDLARAWQKDIGSCFYKMMERNNSAQMQAVDLEMAYLRQVYRDIQKLRSGTSPQTRDEIQARIHFSGLPNDFRGLDQISSNGYLYTRANFILRMAGFVTQGLTTEEGRLAPIATNVRIDYGQALDLNSELLYTPRNDNGSGNTPSFFINYTDSEDEFVQTALRVVFNLTRPGPNYVEWNLGEGNFSTNSKTYIERSLAALYRLEQDLDGQASVFTPELLLSTHEGIARALSISPKRRAFLTMLNRNERFGNGVFSLFALALGTESVDGRYKISDLSGIFDYPLGLMQREELGFAIDGAQYVSDMMLRQTMTAAGTDYYRTRANSSRGTLIIPYSPALDQHIDGLMKSFVSGEMAAVEQAQVAVNNYGVAASQRPVAQRPRVDVSLSITITQPMISSELVHSYDSNLHRFHQTTQNCFATNASCPDFN